MITELPTVFVCRALKAIKPLRGNRCIKKIDVIFIKSDVAWKKNRGILMNKFRNRIYIIPLLTLIEVKKIVSCFYIKLAQIYEIIQSEFKQIIYKICLYVFSYIAYWKIKSAI